MMLPHDVWGWIEAIVPILFFLATTFGFLKRLSRLAAHSVCLSGQRVSDDAGPALWYRFAIQNNEDACLAGRRRVTIAILDDGKFLEGGQRLFVGRNAIRGSMEDDRTLTLRFDELPAYDTWIIECRTDERARTLSLTIDDEMDSAPEEKPANGKKDEASGALLKLPAVLSHTRLELKRDRETAYVGAAYLPEGHWAVVATLLIGILPYVAWAYYRGWDWWDLGPVLLLSLFGWGLWRAIRRRAPSIAQGYWTERPLTAETPGATKIASA